MKISSPPARDYAWDNIRFVLMFSVVFAHLLEICAPFAGRWDIYKFIYSFHMPVFIFMFGYYVRYAPKQIVYRWFIPYLIFQSAYLVFARVVLKNNVAFQFTTPYWLLWYMPACIYYQLLLPLLDTDDEYKQVLTVLGAFVIALFVGYENSVGYYMSLSRFFVFQPWFILGYYCKKNNLLERLSRSPKKQLFVLFASLAMIVCLAPYFRTVPNGLLYGSYSYSNCKGTLWMRGAAALMSCSVILFLFVGIKKFLGKKLFLITYIGQNTWPVFLLHGFIVRAVPVYFPYLVSSPWRVILLTCALLILTGNKLWSNVIHYTCFSWVAKLPEEPAPKKKKR